MMTLNRRTMIKIGGAAAALPLLGNRAFAQEKLKVGFVLIGTPDDNGWNAGHDRGRKEMLAAIGEDKVETTVVTNVAEGPDSERVFRELGSVIAPAALVGDMARDRGDGEDVRMIAIESGASQQRQQRTRDPLDGHDVDVIHARPVSRVAVFDGGEAESTAGVVDEGVHGAESLQVVTQRVHLRLVREVRSEDIGAGHRIQPPYPLHPIFVADIFLPRANEAGERLDSFARLGQCVG